MPSPSSGPPWYGLDASSLRHLELHEAQAHAQSGRRVVDLGDAVLLHDPADAAPFLNRVSALRLPDDAAAFDRRLGDLLRLFATLDRRPHVWVGPGLFSPADLVARLRTVGFLEVGAAYLMLAAGVAAEVAARPGLSTGGPKSGTVATRMVRVTEQSPANQFVALEQAALVLLDAFGVDDVGQSDLARELEPGDHGDVYVAFEDAEPVAAGRRYTANGATYLSSIGTRDGWRRRGYGSAVTRAMLDDARRLAPDEPVHLAVDLANAPARAVYRGLGFVELGDRAPDFLLG